MGFHNHGTEGFAVERWHKRDNGSPVEFGTPGQIGKPDVPEAAVASLVHPAVSQMSLTSRNTPCEPAKATRIPDAYPYSTVADIAGVLVQPLDYHKTSAGRKGV
jgi:hypothetical protein